MSQMKTSSMIPALTREELEAHWMPFTPNREFKDNPRMIVRAEACHFITADGSLQVPGFGELARDKRARHDQAKG